MLRVIRAVRYGRCRCVDVVAVAVYVVAVAVYVVAV